MPKRIFFLCVSALLFVADRIRGLWATLKRSERPCTKTILLYHAITSGQRARFSWQMKKLTKLATPLPLHRMDDPEHRGHLVAVTFDDGFDCFLDNALPELQATKISVALFLPTGLLGAFPSWMSESALKTQGLGSSTRIITAQELSDLPRELITIGSHCVTHRDLRTLDDVDAAHELMESKRALECLIGKNTSTVAFPYNSYDIRILRLARRAGYEQCLAGYRHPPLDGASGSYVRGRISTSPDDWKIEFVLKVTGAYRWRHLACKAKDAVTQSASAALKWRKQVFRDARFPGAFK